MKFALFSDLHQEIRAAEPLVLPPQEVDLVILAGDIGRHTHGMAWAAETFARWPCSPQVIYVAGNHEYYGAHLGLLAELRRPRFPGVTLLERSTVVCQGVRVLGCTLWSSFDLAGLALQQASMRRAQQGINDFSRILARDGAHLQPDDMLRLHKTALRWLDAELSQPFDGKTVVVTHFAPHPGCVAEQYRESDLSPYFVTDLVWLMEKHPITVWCHGHTHTNNDFVAENGCRILSNQRGYPNERSQIGFQAELAVEV